MKITTHELLELIEAVKKRVVDERPPASVVITRTPLPVRTFLLKDGQSVDVSRSDVTIELCAGMKTSLVYDTNEDGQPRQHRLLEPGDKFHFQVTNTETVNHPVPASEKRKGRKL